MNKTQIRKALTECAFDPRKAGPLKVISDVGNTKYYLHRAIESVVKAANQTDIKGELMFSAVEEIDIAISLLALAKVKICTKK